MAKPKKITQNINKDAGLMDLPKVRVPRSQWESRHSNYITSNIGDIVPIYVDEIIPNEKRRITMGMLSHLQTPIAPIFNSQYTELRSFFVPYRMCSDLLAGYKTRKSPWVKVFGEDNSSTSAEIVVPLANQKLPSVSSYLTNDFKNNFEAFGGLADALDCDVQNSDMFTSLNFLDFAAYELIYQYKYRNQNREAATNSSLYKWCFNLYNRTDPAGSGYSDKFHKAQREKDYFTGAAPFAEKGDPVNVGVLGEANINLKSEISTTGDFEVFGSQNNSSSVSLQMANASGDSNLHPISIKADLSSASGVNIEQLRVMIKTQELLEKDAIWGSDYASSLNAHFGTAPISLVLDEPLELKKVTITTQMQPIFQTSSTSGESTILGTIGANSTTQSGDFEIVPLTEFKEHGVLMICAVHKAQNSYDSLDYKPARIFKKARFDFYTPELNDLGFQPVSRKQFDYKDYVSSLSENVGYNEAWAEYRFGKFNVVHGMFEPGRTGAQSYWTLSVSRVADLQSLYLQGESELNRAISVESTTFPSFFDAYGFIEYNDKPMSLHSIPGMDGVI